MYIAELQGKIPKELRRSEDILTSNVFSFFKYSDRDVYLRRLLSLLDLDIPSHEILDADFIFWPKYDDLTEPDLVIVVGQYYLLFEAKYLSEFGIGGPNTRNQLERELDGGFREARSLRKKFVPIAITAHSHFPKDIFRNVPEEYRDCFRWINWQTISSLLLDLLEKHEGQIPNYNFANDLYALLDNKNLRGFLTFDRLLGVYPYDSVETIFFSAQSARFRGNFIGFTEALSEIPAVEQTNYRLFFKRIYFHNMPIFLGDSEEIRSFRRANE